MNLWIRESVICFSRVAGLGRQKKLPNRQKKLQRVFSLTKGNTSMDTACSNKKFGASFHYMRREELPLSFAGLFLQGRSWKILQVKWHRRYCSWKKKKELHLKFSIMFAMGYMAVDQLFWLNENLEGLCMKTAKSMRIFRDFPKLVEWSSWHLYPSR